MALPPIDRLRRWCGQFYQRQVAVLWQKCHRLSQRVLQRPEGLPQVAEAGLAPGLRLHILAGHDLFRVPFAGQRLVWNVARRGMATVSSALNVSFPTAAAIDRLEASSLTKLQSQQQHVLIRLAAPTLLLTEDVKGSLEAYRVAIDQWVNKTTALLTALEALGFPVQRGNQGEICVCGGTAELAQALNRTKSPNLLSAIHVEASGSEGEATPYCTLASSASIVSSSSWNDLSLIFPHLREAELEEAFSDLSSTSLASSQG